MLDFLRDPVWQFVGALFAFVAIGVSIYLFVLQRNRKSLSYQLISDTPLLTVDEEIRGKLRIVYEGTLVQHVHLLILALLNDGNVPIVSSDFERPLVLAFGSDSKILSAEITKTVPKTLEPRITIHENRIMLEPILLNSQDSVTIKLLLTQFTGMVDTDARIIGVKEVKKQERPKAPSFLRILVSSALALLSIGMIPVVWVVRPDAQGSAKSLLSLMCLLAAFIFTSLLRSSVNDR